MDAMGCSNKKAISIMKELDIESGIGLIEKKRQGQGKPTMIYLKQFMIQDAQKMCIRDSLCIIRWCKFSKMDRITVIPPHVFLIYCLRIMRNCAIILTGIPDFLQLLGKLDHISNLCLRITFINVKQCLVVNKLIHSCSIGHIFLNNILSPMWPVMRLE